jgi:hypothetical protein
VVTYGLREEDAMARYVRVAAAQMGPINEGTGRDEVVERMLVLLERPSPITSS